VLAPELGAPLEAADMVELGDHQCYARLSHRGERLPSFWLRLDPPPEGDPVVRDVLAATSAAAYGRDAAAVAADREALLERIAELGRAAASAGTGEARDDPGKGAVPAPQPERTRRRRNRGGSRGGRTRRAGDPPRSPKNDGPTPPAADGGQDRTGETDDPEGKGEP
jgi:hypothetical protein